MAPADILWPLPSGKLPLGAADIHVWAARLDAPAEFLSRCAALLAPDEQERAARFRFDQHRHRFIFGRAILRSLLGGYLNCPAQNVQFSYGPHGKPLLAKEFSQSDMHFNLAHSEDLALFAVTRRAPVGIDVEQIRPVADAADLVERFFSPRENALFRQLFEDQKSIAFFTLWTRKEAWLKAFGEGIAHSLNRVEVTFLPDEPARLLALPKESGSLSDWTLHQLIPAPGFIGAVALPNLRLAVSNFQFSIPQLFGNSL
jgi:4'-phosphopantetheinyl transferase